MSVFYLLIFLYCMCFIVCVVMAIIHRITNAKQNLKEVVFLMCSWNFFRKGNNVAFNYENTRAAMAFFFVAGIDQCII